MTFWALVMLGLKLVGAVSLIVLTIFGLSLVVVAGRASRFEERR